MTLQEVQQIVDQYLLLFPEEAPALRKLQERLDIDEIFNNRKSFVGHGTGGAIVLSPDRKKLLLVHYKTLGKWLQPGGHWDPEEPNPWTAARREAEEETAVHLAMMLPVVASKPHVPIDIGTHDIPANAKKHEPAHVHYDFRYIFIAESEELSARAEEVHAVAWVPIRSNEVRLQELQHIVGKMKKLKII